ncbi:glucosamine-6-phosphate deaminase [Microbacterium sp. VKM Ac-2923]|uniref:glucosamine-6-phosphate deaminase n=1 Tax=Microbacterium sp. VKM Ac-2923 TaxID=2929476 RepID=UPI001FB3AE26|nr:glucosamine-6-phosphate deaminase [Microbacterium sp. VKM Ac-2923]MCJ1708780.1 glucosamine-6-phosphate deaminase [Microbacterium sp. VKM Ac-2923]
MTETTLHAPLAPISPWTRVVMVDADAIGDVAADVVAMIAPDGVLGVATGSSPLALYAALIRRRAEGLATEGLRLFALDEYVGLDASDPRSYAAYVRSVIARPLGIPAENVRVPRGSTGADGAAYERAIAAEGGVDVQIVGIGRNGHIGFNEPGSDAETRTRVVELDESTRRANAEHFDGDLSRVPTHAMTQGVATILSARRIVLVASGAAKAAALRAALTGPITPDNPASFLQRHPDVTVVADPDALREHR